MSTTDAKQSRKQKQKRVQIAPRSECCRSPQGCRPSSPTQPARRDLLAERPSLGDRRHDHLESVLSWKAAYEAVRLRISVILFFSLAFKQFWNRVNKESIPSRAYIAFKTEELVATFSREYDGHLFRDKAGGLGNFHRIRRRFFFLCYVILYYTCSPVPGLILTDRERQRVVRRRGIRTVSKSACREEKGRRTKQYDRQRCDGGGGNCSVALSNLISLVQHRRGLPLLPRDAEEYGKGRICLARNVE